MGKPVRQAVQSIALPQATGAAAAPALWPRLALRAALSCAIAGLFLWLLAARLQEIDPGALMQALGAVPLAQWLAAMAFTGLSFWALGQYDAVLHRHFCTGVPAAVARRAGICAIAVSQMLGLGVITGSILRWRMLPGCTLLTATQITTAVALSFLAGWAVVTAGAILLLPGAPFKAAALATLVAAACGVLLCLAAPRLARLPFRWPNAFTLTRLMLFCAVDTLAAAAAFHVLCPPGLALPFAVLLPAFLLALGAGLVSGTPGGVGAFEVTLLAVLATHPEAELMAAILAWRLVYFALPAILGALIAVIGPYRAQPAPAPPLPALHHSRRAETELLRQGEHRLLPVLPGRAWLAGRTSHLLVGLFDQIGPPFGPDPAADRASLAAFRATAKGEGRLPVLYKCTARTAARARAAGFAPLRIAREAWVDPRSFRLAAASRAGLRRKLRRAEAAGITVTGPADAPARLPFAEMDALAARWSAAHGGERGFSMGRYTRAHVQGQRTYLAHQSGRLIAFITFHETLAEWALDLMRHAPDLPDGTMQLLVQTAIDDARRLDVPRLSLAAAPEAAFHVPLHSAARLRALLHGRRGAGLAQFKSCFAPQWQPLYLAAPHRPGLVLAALGLARAIANPPPIPPQIEHLHEDYQFAPEPAPWHRQRL